MPFFVVEGPFFSYRFQADEIKQFGENTLKEIITATSHVLPFHCS
jgi:hypothetical protein